MKLTVETQDLYTEYIEGDWELMPFPAVNGKRPSRLILMWGHMNIENTTLSERFAIYSLSLDYAGIYLARHTRILAIYN